VKSYLFFLKKFGGGFSRTSKNDWKIIIMRKSFIFLRDVVLFYFHITQLFNHSLKIKWNELFLQLVVLITASGFQGVQPLIE